MKPTALDKRIKRRITARQHDFFAVCAPGLSRLCMEELQGLACTPPLDPTAVAMVTGGIEFQGQVHDGYAANLGLRSPSRILLRMARFKAENFRTLEKKLKEIDWELYLQPQAEITIHASSTHSRLYHDDAIAQRAREIIALYVKQPVSTPDNRVSMPAHAIYLRGDQDRFEVSLDSSGDLLHRRGIKPDVGAAPLRETLAWAILHMAGYTGREPLIDPMCGSGTIALEGVMIRRNIPPGLFRSFAFEHWPCFSPGRWNHMKAQAQADIKPDADPMIFASDQDAAILSSLETILRKRPVLSGIRVFQQDFFDLDPRRLTRSPGVAILNPPYGLRLDTGIDTEKFYVEIGKKLGNDFRGWKIGLVLPERNLASTIPFPVRLTPLFHGGLELNLATARVP